jgi:hypothetical protein
MQLKTVKSTLDNAKHFLASHDFIQILQHFAFDGESVTAFNDLQGVRLQLETNLECTIPGNLLLRLLNTLSHEQIEIIKHPDGSHVVVQSGKSQQKLPMLPLDEFVFTMPEMPEHPISVPSAVIDGLRSCLINVSTNPTRPEFNGVNVVIESNGITLYSSDGLSISRFKLDHDFNVPALKEIQAIIPAFFCDKLVNLQSALSGSNKDVECAFVKEGFLVNLNNNYLLTKIIDRKPPDCENTIGSYAPDLENEIFWDIPEELNSILDRATLFLDPLHGISHSTFKVSGKEVTVLTSSSVGTSVDTLQIPAVLEDFSFQVDPNLLLRAFKVCRSMTIKPNLILFKNPNFVHLIATTVIK